MRRAGDPLYGEFERTLTPIDPLYINDSSSPISRSHISLHSLSGPNPFKFNSPVFTYPSVQRQGVYPENHIMRTRFPKVLYSGGVCANFPDWGK